MYQQVRQRVLRHQRLAKPKYYGTRSVDRVPRYWNHAGTQHRREIRGCVPNSCLFSLAGRDSPVMQARMRCKIADHAQVIVLFLPRKASTGGQRRETDNLAFVHSHIC